MKTKHILTYTLISSCLLSGCSSQASYYTMSGTMAGASLGGELGEAIGWISGGNNRYGSSLVGRVIGTVAGGAIGYGITKKQEANTQNSHNSYNDYSNYNDYNDSNAKKRNRIGYSESIASSNLAISKAQYQDEDGDGKISKGETCTVTFEVTNHGQSLISDMVLGVNEENKSKYYAFSPSTPNVSVAPGGTLRYKAKVYCKKKPTESVATLQLSASSFDDQSQTTAILKIPTSNQ